MPRVAVAAVKACERSQEPITFDTADHVVAVIVNAICPSIVFSILIAIGLLILVLIGLTFLFYDFVFAIFCMC